MRFSSPLNEQKHRNQIWNERPDRTDMISNSCFETAFFNFINRINSYFFQVETTTRNAQISGFSTSSIYLHGKRKLRKNHPASNFNLPRQVNVEKYTTKSWKQTHYNTHATTTAPPEVLFDTSQQSISKNALSRSKSTITFVCLSVSY